MHKTPSFFGICIYLTPHFHTVGEAVGPLDILYEFGVLDCGSDLESPLADDTRRPVLLFGELSSNIGALGGLYPKKWQEVAMGQNLHAVLEGFEPTTGIRLV